MTATTKAVFGALLALCIQSARGRDVVSFDFGWKHRTGLTAWAPPDAQPPVNPNPGLSPPEAQVNYTASDWVTVQLPHDGLIAARPSKAACPDGCSGKSYIPRHVLWYRKTFVLPSDWAGSAIWLDFDGSFRLTTVFVNGVLATSHDCGYTPFRLRLDNITGVQHDEPTVVAVFVDPDNGDIGGQERGSGWWYEGGGLYRHVHLVRADTVHIEQDGLFAYSNLTWPDEANELLSLPASPETESLSNPTGPSSSSSPTAVLHASVAVANTGAQDASICVGFLLTGFDGSVVATNFTAPFTIPSASSSSAYATLVVPSPSLWTAPSPTLYNLTASVYTGADCSGASTPLDSVHGPHGFRSLRYDANDGFFLNKDHFKVRGFCDHNNFAVVGMAVPERVNLFRAQASRAVGGNGRRTSHNPPDKSMLDIYDRLGVVVMDENRLFANETRYVDNMGVMVKRDRNHPSVVIWSFCNERGCEGADEAGGPRFQEIAYRYDGSRPTLANMFTFGDLLSNTIDVQGFSHESREQLDVCHAKLPNKPIFLSECCSCNTYRDEDEGCETLHDNPHRMCIEKSFNARCAESNKATNASDGVNYAVGTMVWTLFDYYGEPSVGGPEVSSSYGQYDLAGFPKAAAFWYRTQWLLTIPDGPDKTFYTNGSHEVYLVESWESPDSFPSTKGNTTRAIHAYSSASSIEIFVNGKSHGTRAVRPMREGPGSYAEWLEVPWEAGNLTAVARDSTGNPVATTARFTNGNASSLRLSLDVPSKHTGTGSALLLDGQDAALLRAAVVDSSGSVIHLATNNVTFRVVSGPGFVQGTNNGDQHCYEPNNAPWHSAFHGLVRAVVRVTGTTARSARETSLLVKIDVDGPMAAVKQVTSPEGPIVVEASSPGFDPVRISIPVSNDPLTAGVYAIAEAAAGKPVDFFAI